MRRIAIVAAGGFGDALIFNSAALALKNKGVETTLFSDSIGGFGKWLEGPFAPQPGSSEKFEGFAAVFLQHDNSLKARAIYNLPFPVFTFFGSHKVSKHGPLKEGRDFVADPNQTMIENLKKALQLLFQISCKELPSGLKPPPHLTYCRYPKRIVIHPLSASKEKNWLKQRFLKVACWLEKEGFKPLFATPPEERLIWGGPSISSLETLASLIYESGGFLGNDSGPGHIASALHIPHLILGQSEKHLRLWRPGWGQGAILTPPSWIPPLRLKEKCWKQLITENNVITSLKNSVLRY